MRFFKSLVYRETHNLSKILILKMSKNINIIKNKFYLFSNWNRVNQIKNYEINMIMIYTKIWDKKLIKIDNA